MGNRCSCGRPRANICFVHLARSVTRLCSARQIGARLLALLLQQEGIWLPSAPWLGRSCVWLVALWSHRNCLSLFKRKKEKQGTDVRHESQQHQAGRKAPTYENVSESPVYATVSKPKNMKQDDSIHYADIQVFTKVRERSAEEVKNLQMQNATEYATLNFPRPRLKYDSKNGTLV